MKKIVLMIMACLCTIVAMYAQNKANITDENLSNKGLITEFMGIPVDGDKSDMIDKLESKGFVYNEELECLEGEFNGEEVLIDIKTNNNKVCRIAIIDKIGRNEQQIKIRFNRLCEQFENNKKYVFLGESQIIPEETDISFEMNVNKKSYIAFYYQNIDINQVETTLLKSKYLEMIDKVNGTFKEDMVDLMERYNPFPTFILIDYLKLMRKVGVILYGTNGKYRVGIMYDNDYNTANGEDL